MEVFDGGVVEVVVVELGANKLLKIFPLFGRLEEKKFKHLL